MRKLVLSVILITLFITKTNSQEINLNGYDIKIPSNEKYALFPLREIETASLMGATTSEFIIEKHLNGIEDLGFDLNSNTLTIATEKYLSGLKLLLDDVVSGKPAFRWKSAELLKPCERFSNEKKYFKCFIEQFGWDYYVQLDVAKTEPIYKKDELITSQIEINKGIKEAFNVINENKVLNLKKTNFIVGYDKNDNFFVEGDFQLKAFHHVNYGRLLIAFVDDKLIRLKVDCFKKDKCFQAHQVYKNIKTQFIVDQDILLKANLKKSDEISSFLGKAKNGYRAYKLTKYLLLLL